MNEITGKVHLIEQEKEVGNNGFKKRLLVVETEEQYKQYIPIDFLKDKCNLLDKFKTGDSVKVSINVRGNEYNGKYYVSVSGWKIESTDVTNSNHPTNKPPKNQDKPKEYIGNDIPFNEEDHDDLPF